MAYAKGTIVELRLEPDGLSARINCPLNIQPAPGQYLLSSSGSLTEPLPIPLFPASLPGPEWQTAPGLPAHWTAGTRLRLHGPLGSGFHLPADSRRVVLAAYQSSPALLLPLVQLALAQNAEVAFFAQSAPAGLPSEVEISPLETLAEALAWTDYLAVSFPRALLSDFRSLAGLKPHQRFPALSEGLLLTSMPCAGLADCGVCAVATSQGWKYACRDGPVFHLNFLEES
jgi:hypothetical protein